MNKYAVPACPTFPFADPLSSHLFRDELTGDIVIVAPGRRYRPDTVSQHKVKDPLALKHLAQEKILAVYGKGKHRMLAIENAFPVFHSDRELKGRQEMLVEGTEVRPFSDFTAGQMASALDALRERSKIFRRDPTLKYMVVFKNEGKEAGASLLHPHSQIFGLCFVPERLRRLSRNLKTARHSHTSPHVRALTEATKDRIIYADKLAVAFADPYSRFAYGVRILPRRCLDNITQTTPAERKSLAKALYALMPLVRQHELSYNFHFHDVFSDEHEVFEIKFAPRANIWAGFELDAGIVINPVPAECAAYEYRQARKT